jgi:hypothetical protein
LRSAIGRARQVDDKGLDVHVKPERAKSKFSRNGVLYLLCA